MKYKKIAFFSLFVLFAVIFGFAVKNAWATTLFSDNFDDNAIDDTLWTELDPSTFITETGGKIVLSDSGDWGTTALISTTTFPRAASTTFMATVNLSHPYVMYGFKGNVASSSFTNMKYGIYFFDQTAGGGGNRQLIIYEDGTSRGEKGLGWSLNTDYRIAIMMKATGALYYIQGGIYGTLGTNDWTILYDSSYSSASGIKVGFTSKDDSNTSTIMTMDDVSVVDTALPISVIIKNQMLSKPLDNGITILFKTNVTTNLTLEYGLDDTYGSSTTTSNQTMHEINLTGLNPATTYHYRATFAENANTNNTTTTLDSTFKTKISTSTSFVAGMITDTQGCTFSNVVTQLGLLNPDILISTGDNMMGESATTIGTFRYRWGIDFFDYVQSLTNHIPFYTAFGNHDGVVSSYTAGASAYGTELAMPTSTSGGELYYSFDYGPAHFVVLNGSTATSGIQGVINDTQLAWLAADLASTSQAYKIVLGHYMVYGWDDTAFFASTTWRYSNFEAVHAVLRDNDVLAYIGGHRHTYNRYVKEGVYYITNPAAGADWCTLDPAEYGPGDYANVGGDAGTIANAIGYYPGYTKLSVSASRVSAITYKDDGTTLADYDLTPTNFELSSPSDDGTIADATPILTWNASSDNAAGLSKYQIYVDGVLALDNIPSTTVSIALETPLEEGAHTWYVKAVNAAGWSTQSNSTYTLTLDLTAPGAPGQMTSSTIATSSLLAIFGATSTGSNFSQYKIFYKIGSSGVSESDTEINSSTDPNLGNVNFNGATTTLISGLATGIQYVANIWAYDTVGNTVSSTGELTFYTLADTPGMITTPVVTANSIDLTLNFSTNDTVSTSTLYNVCKTDNGTECATGGYYSSSDPLLGSGPNWYTFDQINQGFIQVAGLTPSTSYQFIMQAKNGDGVLTAFSTASTAANTLSAQPVSPTFVSASTSTITLQWGDNGNSSSVIYTITGGEIGDGSTTATNSIMADLIPNKGYTFTVASQNPDASMNAGVTSSVMYTSSTNPTSLTIISTNTTSMVLQWSTNGSATSTVYEITGNNSFTTTHVTSTATNQTVTTSVSGLTPNTSYTFNIASKNNQDNSYNATSSFTAEYTKANDPTSLVVTPSVNGFALSWNENQNPSTTVYYVTAGGVADSSSTTSISVAFLATSTQYTILVRATNSDGTYTTGISTDKYTLATTAGTPTTVASTTTALTLTLGSDTNPTSTTFAIYNSTSGSYLDSAGAATTTAVYQTTSTWGSTITATGLSVDTAYQFTVTARNGDNTNAATSTASTAVYTLTNAAGTPTASAPAITTMDVAIDTNSNPAATTYAIYNSTVGSYLDSTGAATTTPVYQTTSTWDGATATGLTANTSYQFMTVARNGGDTNAATSSASTALYTLASVPSSVAASASGNSITVTFTGDATSFYVVDNSDSTRYSDYTTTLTRTFSSLTCGTSYTFKVKGKNGNDVETAYSSTVSASTDACANNNSGGGGGFFPAIIPMSDSSLLSISAIPIIVDLSLNMPTSVLVGGVPHIVTLTSALASQIDLVIQSEPVKLTLNNKESKNIDINRDSIPDMKLTYLGLVNAKSRVELVSLIDPSEINSAVSINVGAYETDDLGVIVRLNNANAVQVALSNDASFVNASFVPYLQTMKWSLLPGNGQKTVYVRFRSKDGSISSVSDTIKLVNQVKNTIVTPTPPTIKANFDVVFSKISNVSIKQGQSTKFIYSFKNTGKKNTAVRVIRELLNAKGKVISSARAFITVRSGRSFTRTITQSISAKLPVGKYTVRVRVLDSKNKLLNQNQFSVNVTKKK